MGRGLLYLGALAVLAALSGWFLATVESTLRHQARADSQAPLLVMEHFIATRMDELGQRQYTLQAPRLTQLPGDQGARVEQPAMDGYRPDQKKLWMVRAGSGWVAPDNRRIRLDDGVSVTRTAAADQPPLELTTAEVWLHPKESYAESDQPARLETPGGVLTAVGFKVWLDQQRVELLSDVRGTYAPPKP